MKYKKVISISILLRGYFPSASVLALSATCTHKICRRVRKVLNLKDDATEIRLSPDKPNIKMVVKKIPNSVDLGMAWIIDQLDSFPRTIIYCTVFGMSQNCTVILLQKFRTASPSARCFILRHQMQRRKKYWMTFAMKMDHWELLLQPVPLEWG